MKLKELLENENVVWVTERNDNSHLPELRCGAFSLTKELGYYVIRIASFEGTEKPLHKCKTLAEINRYCTHSFNLPEVTPQKEYWLHDDKFICLRIENDERRYGMPMETLRKIVKTVREFEDIESKDQLLYEIELYIKQFLVYNYMDIREKYNAQDQIPLQEVTTKMIREFTAIGKYDGGEC